MSDDEKAIRSVVEGWMQASRRGDLAAILDLMTDDVVFMVPGREPFVAAFKGLDGVKMEGSSEIAELKLLGDWAFIRNHIDITATPPGGSAIRRSGYTLTLLRREADGRWRLARDANLLATLSG